jgi:sugar lactone lactonase YvrE
MTNESQGEYSMNTKSNFLRALLLAVMMLMLVTPAQAYFAPSNGQAATLVLGQPNFTSNTWSTTQSGMAGPFSIAVDPATHKVFVADFANNRVLRFASLYALTNGAAAEAVLGQPNFTSNSSSITQSGMDRPIGVFVDAGGRLWVADQYNSRVLRFDHASTIASGANANGVLGQLDFTSNGLATTQSGMDNPIGVFVDSSGRLWVADTWNYRVLRFDNAASKANGADADGVLGQPNFTSHSSATTQKGMYAPTGVFVDASGRLWVADYDNNRVLRFDNAASKANGARADGVLGQPNFISRGTATTQSGMNLPFDITVDNATGRLYVVEVNNSRILVFNSAASLANGANASYVIGQTNFTTGTPNTGGISATTLDSPVSIFFDQISKVLLTADNNNSRVLMYGKPSRYFSSTSTAAYDGWVLESTATSNVGGSLNSTNATGLVVGDDASNRQYRSILYFDTSTLPDNAVIRSATLKIYKAWAGGTDPLTLSAFGPLLADVKKGTFGTAALQTTDFQATASANAIGHFSSIGGGWYRLVVPAVDYTYINLTGATQFRLRFTSTSNKNNAANYDAFYAGDATTSAGSSSVEYRVQPAIRQGQSVIRAPPLIIKSETLFCFIDQLFFFPMLLSQSPC